MLQKNSFMIFVVFGLLFESRLWISCRGEFDESFALKVTGKVRVITSLWGTKMTSNVPSDFQLVCSFDRGLFLFKEMKQHAYPNSST